MRPPNWPQIAVARRAPAPIFLRGFARKEYDRRCHRSGLSPGSRFLALKFEKKPFRRPLRLEDSCDDTADR